MLKMKGEYRIYEGGKVKGTEIIGGRLIECFHNVICTPVYETLLKNLNGDTATVIGVNYFAFGTGTTTPVESDIKLETEFFRKAYTSKSWSGKQFVALCQLKTDEGNGSITEVGIFAGGSIAADSGTLLSHALKPIVKNSNIVYNIQYRLTFSEEE